jgi:hypothetical protein
MCMFIKFKEILKFFLTTFISILNSDIKSPKVCFHPQVKDDTNPFFPVLEFQLSVLKKGNTEFLYLCPGH